MMPKGPGPTDRDHFGLLVVLLIAVMVVSGVADRAWVRVVAASFSLAAFAVGFAHTRSQSRLWTAAGLLVVGIVGVLLIGSSATDETGAGLGATILMILVGALTLAVLARLLEHQQVTNQTILGAVAGYLLIGQVFAWAYMALSGFVDGAVLSPAPQGEFPIYFSYVVLTTLGFGDVQPIGALAQRITVLEALLGQLYLAILLSRLVSLYTRNQAPMTHPDDPADTDPT